MWRNTVTSCHMTVTMWHLWCDTFLHSLLCSKSKIKEKEKKRNININLAVLPSHDSRQQALRIWGQARLYSSIPGYLSYPRASSYKWWNIYPKGEDNGYTSVNPHNFCLVFTYEQITASLQVTILTTLTLRTATILNQNQLHSNILAALSSNSSIFEHLLHPEGHWSKDDTDFLRLDDRMYILDNANLCLQVLQYHHNYVLVGHLGQNKTLGLVWRHYT